MKKVVVIGGGTGLSTLLRGLRDYPLDITAIVTMTDDGASSGKLRKSRGILPPGDIRKCIAALSVDETGLNELFEYRYQQGFGLKGHSVGNLLIAALMEMSGSFEMAVERISDILNIHGRVLPATLDDVHLAGSFEDGHKIVGQVQIQKYMHKHRLKKMKLSGPTKTNPRAIKAIEVADIIIVGPGSLFSSIIPSFLQQKLAIAVKTAKAPKVYVANVSTERGETEGFTLEDHLKALSKYRFSPDIVLVNESRHATVGGDIYVHPVLVEKKVGYEEKRVFVDVVSRQNPVYHDSFLLGKECYRLILRSNKLLQK